MSTLLFIFNRSDSDVAAAVKRADTAWLTQLMEDTIRHTFEGIAEYEENRDVVVTFPDDKSDYLFGTNNADAAKLAVAQWNGYVQRDFTSALGAYFTECAKSGDACLDSLLTYRLAKAAASLDNQASIYAERLVVNSTVGVIRTVLSDAEVEVLTNDPTYIAIAKVTCQPA